MGKWGGDPRTAAPAWRSEAFGTNEIDCSANCGLQDRATIDDRHIVTAARPPRMAKHSAPARTRRFTTAVNVRRPNAIRISSYSP